MTAQTGYQDHKTDRLARLRRVESQVRGVTRMAAEDRQYIDVLTQINAATHTVQEVALGLPDDHT
ncbi:metal-sensing transcriptional repressor [Streptomyces albogriseolus]|uniref:metal-sensing transcriptional repressor n=1 Tax=Streptomyces albogriseolus TaxID=1887 RepID=UPI00345F7ABD